jgi:CheY-like chemotaxis protein
MVDILIVEDNKEISSLLKDFLEKENYIASVAETGEKALSLYEKYGAKLVLLDIMLPGIDGFNVCSKIRENANTPIIILSAKIGKEDKLNGITLPKLPLLKEANFCNITLINATSLDFSASEKLENFRATGSGNITSVKFADGVSLNTLYIPPTLSSLSLV